MPDDLSDSTNLGTSVITTCTSVEVRGVGNGARAAEGLEKHHAVRGGCGKLANWGAQVPPFGSGTQGREELVGLVAHVFIHEAFTLQIASSCSITGLYQVTGGAGEMGWLPCISHLLLPKRVPAGLPTSLNFHTERRLLFYRT